MPPSVRGVVFDLDGTLVDSFEAITDGVNHARAAFDLPALPAGVVRGHVGRGLEVLLADLLGADRVDDGVRLFRERYAATYAEGTRLLPGVEETLARLDGRGIPMAVASNKPARFGRPICESLGIGGRFRSILGPDVVGSTKPDPAMLLRAFESLGVGPDRALYVGDMTLDVESARRAGVSVCLVATGSEPREILERCGVPVIDRLSELPDRI